MARGVGRISAPWASLASRAPLAVGPLATALRLPSLGDSLVVGCGVVLLAIGCWLLEKASFKRPTKKNRAATTAEQGPNAQRGFGTAKKYVSPDAISVRSLKKHMGSVAGIVSAVSAGITFSRRGHTNQPTSQI